MNDIDIHRGFSSSEEDCENDTDDRPLFIDWLDLSSCGCGRDEVIGISPLPGCRFKENRRSLSRDIGHLKREGIKDVVCLCTKGELKKYRVPNLLTELSDSSMCVHHHPFPDGHVPSIEGLVEILQQLRLNLMNTRKTIIHCYGGLGRSALVAACFLLMVDESLTPESSIASIRLLRGPRAVQTVKQYNLINDFRKLYSEFTTTGKASRPISR